MNAVAEQLTGWSAADALGCLAGSVLRFSEHADRGGRDDPVERSLLARKPVAFERKLFVKGAVAARESVRGAVTPALNRAGRLIGTIVTLCRTTVARQAQADVASIEDRLRAVLNTTFDGVMLLDGVGTILTFGPSCVRLFEYAAVEVIGRPVQILMSSLLFNDIGRAPGPTAAKDSAPVAFWTGVTRGRRKDGSTFPAELAVGQASSGSASVFVNVVHDVTERNGLESALLGSVAREQRKLGSEMHDGLGQELAGLSFLIAAIARKAQRKALVTTVDLKQLASVATRALQSCHDIALGLSPIEESHGGLAAGLRTLVARLNKLPGPAVRLTIYGSPAGELAPPVADHLYRIAQEALSNALKHAHATAVAVTLAIGTGTVQLEIRDDGVGIKLPDPNRQRLGLRTMRYRAAAVGAQLAITPAPGGGTRVVCDYPHTAPQRHERARRPRAARS